MEYISSESLLMASLIVSIVFTAMFFIFCSKSNVLARFGHPEKCLSWKEFKVLVIAAFVPTIGLILSSQTFNFTWTKDETDFLVVINLMICILGDIVYDGLKDVMLKMGLN